MLMWVNNNFRFSVFFTTTLINMESDVLFTRWFKYDGD